MRTVRARARWKAAAAAVTVLMALPGCGGGGGDDDDDFGRETLVGTWRVRAIGLGRQATQECPAALRDESGEEVIACGSDDRALYEQDGSFVGESDAFLGARAQIRGTWDLDDRTLRVRITQFGVDADGSGAVDPDEFEDLDPPQVNTAAVRFDSARRVLLESEADDTRTVLEKL